MRSCALLILLVFSDVAHTQNNFSAQIKAIVNDTAHGFKNVRGEYDEELYVYRPKFIIDSTYDGRVFNLATRSYFVFYLSNSEFADSALASEVMIRWKNKIGAALGPSFSVAPEKAPLGLKRSFDRGFVFTHQKLSIAVEQLNKVLDKKKIHYVRVFILHKPGI